MNIDNTTTDDIIIPDESIDYLMLSLPNNKSQAIKSITDTYLAQLDPDEDHEPEKLAGDLIDIMKHEFRLHNQNAGKDDRWPLPQTLEPAQIAELMLFNHKIKNINCAGTGNNKEYDLLAVYQEFGKDEGIYISAQDELEKLIKKYQFNIKTNDIKEVIHDLTIKAERTKRCEDRDLIAVNNGIFDYKNKILLPFDPELVFTAKCRVNYNPGASVSPVIHNEDGTDWNVETWIRELFEDGSDIPLAMWQVISAAVRPNVRFGKMVLLSSEKGNNGKGSICSLIRNLIGEGSYASVPLSDFGKDFMLEQLINTIANIVDENDVGIYIDKAANLKAVITNDVCSINRKFKTPISYRFSGINIQCVNELPRCKDRSESLFRRILLIPFNQCYTGRERKYIKDDYLKRTDVLEYVLHKVLHMQHYEITEPQACRDALDDFKLYNDPVRDFLDEVLPQLSWDCVPSKILYSMYTGWFKINNPSGTIQKQKTFSREVRCLIVPEEHGWYYRDEPYDVRSFMNVEEPLLDEFNCTEFMQNADSKNRDLRVNTNFDKPKTRGIFRCNPKIPDEKKQATT